MSRARNTILVVDDVPENIAVLEEILKEEYRVLAATSGDAALRIARTAPAPDLILLDVLMPDIDGFEVCRRLREDTQGAAIPVIFLSVRGGAADEAMGFDLGAVDYIVKPVDPYIVKTRVRAHLERAEDALRASEVRYRRLFETARDGLLTVDAATGTVVDANPFLMRLIGSTLDEFLGERIWDLASLRQIAGSAAQLQEARRVGLTGPKALELHRADGRTIHVELLGSAYTVNRRDIVQFSVHDVTERRLAEAERDRLEAQLRQSQKMEAVGRLAGGVAHDFNNMLQVISGYLEVIRRRATAADSQLGPFLDEIEKATGSAARLTGQLLALSRRQALQLRPVVLDELVTDTLGMIRRVIGDDITLDFRPQPVLPHVNADAGQIEQVLVNLCLNSRDAMPSGGRITIETSLVEVDAAYVAAHPWARPGPHVMLAVSDTGCGMDRATLNRLFEPFFTTKEAGKGTGLGLSVVYGIVKQHGGMISAYSEQGHGAVFKIYLRAVEASAAPGAVESGRQAVAGGTERILVAEDDRAIRVLAEQSLTEAGYRVVAVPDGQAALAALQEHSDISLALLDAVMPGMNGEDLYLRVRALRPGLPVLFSSGYSTHTHLTRFVQERAIQLIQKPYALHDLLRRIRAMLDAAARS